MWVYICQIYGGPRDITTKKTMLLTKWQLSSYQENKTIQTTLVFYLQRDFFISSVEIFISSG